MDAQSADHHRGVEALATSRQLDPFNRFRATNVWLGLHHFAGTPATTVKSKAATLDLNAPARELVESVYR
ncbi:MAG: hypothetical protein JNM17_03875 [Archangium sp.]|nr:hypothetical protein [Archangium sp.]